MPGNKPSSQGNPILGGSIATIAGLFLVLVSVDVIHTDPEGIHAPRWVLTLVGMMFTFVGLYILSTGMLSPGEQKTAVVQWIQYFLLVGMLAAFATIFLWTGFGSGEREFSSSGSLLFFTVSGTGNELVGRILFGGCGLVAALITILAAFGGAQRIMAETTKRDSTDE